MCHYFIKATGGKGTIINAVSLGASFLFPGMSSYSISKLAMIKLGEFLDLGRDIILSDSSRKLTGAHRAP